MKQFFLSGMLLLTLAACNPNSSDSREQTIADSLALDTALTDTTNALNSAYDASLALLKDIEVDTATFKQLYNSCRTRGDEFSDSKFLFDKSSPRLVNSNGLYAYVNETSPGLRFCVQYYAENRLFIKTMIFNIDGESFNYTANFKADSGDNHVWEWSDEKVGDARIPLLLKLALGKKATVKFIGSQHQEVITITPGQQLSIKKMLMIYKGLLLGYNA